jgi:hypothetical protein
MPLLLDSRGNFDDGTNQFGMWANGSGAKQSVAWRNFTETGLPGGTATTMSINDSFKNNNLFLGIILLK